MELFTQERKTRLSKRVVPILFLLPVLGFLVGGWNAQPLNRALDSDLAFAEPQRMRPGEPPPPKVRNMGKDQSEMVFIEAGEFLMGMDKGDPAEGPAHKVHLNAYWIDRYEVTNAQYMKFMEATRHTPPSSWGSPKLNEPEQPVVGVS